MVVSRKKNLTPFAGMYTSSANYSESSFEESIQDMLWSAIKPNENGNTGRYNQGGRSTDRSYSDDFLKWYYNVPQKSEQEKETK